MLLHTLLVIAVMVSAIPMQSRGQGLRRALHRVDSFLTARYRGGNIDTAYLTRPPTKWTVTGRLNFAGATLKSEGIEANIPFRSEVKAAYKSTLSVGVKYLGVALSLSLNPAKLMGKYKDYEINIRSYGNRWGFDFVYQDASNFTGWYQDEGMPRIDLPADVLSMKAVNLNAYYVFSHRRFSYPAAFTQSYIQRRSAGSFMVAASFQGQQTSTVGDFESALKVTNIGIGGGYGFNWVPGRHWLLHISALPTFIVYSWTSLKANGNDIPLPYHFPDVIITTNGAIVRHFGNMFVAATAVFNYTDIGNKKRLDIEHTKWRTRLIYGIRF